MSSKALSTKETAFAVLESGIKKAQTKGLKVFALGMLGGLFVSLGFYSTNVNTNKETCI